MGRRRVGRDPPAAGDPQEVIAPERPTAFGLGEDNTKKNMLKR